MNKYLKMTDTERVVDSGFQQEVGRFVRNEVYYNVSSLVAEMSLNIEYQDELIELMISRDYENAVIDYFSAASSGEKIALLQESGIDAPEIQAGSLVDAVNALLQDDETTDFEEIANSFQIEPYDNEIFEHWIVSDFLAKRLEAYGELVNYDFYGLTIWGRSTTGQSISMDSVIQKIKIDLIKGAGA